MPATTEIRWVTPRRTKRSASLPTNPKTMLNRTSDTKRPTARLTNPRREVVSGAKLRDVLRW
jgi:hypothetical protein